MNAQRIAIDFVLAHEGGYVNDAVDLGGATKHGISLRFLRQLAPELADIDRDGDVDPEDIAAIKPHDAARIYRLVFWDSLKLDRLPHRLSIAVMDTAVNMGKSAAVRILQQALNRMGKSLAEDGALGPRTVAAAVACGEADLLINRYLISRIWRYQDIVHANRGLGKFLFGWLNRVRDLEEILSMDLAAIYGDAA